MNPSLRPVILAVFLIAIGIYGFQVDPARQFAYSISIGLGLFILVNIFKSSIKTNNKTKKSQKFSDLYSKNIHYKNIKSDSVKPRKTKNVSQGPKVIQLDDYRQKNTPEHPKAGWSCIYQSMDRTQSLLVQSLLESEGIPTRANNLQVTSFLPVLDNLTLEILVPKVEVETALDLLEKQNLIPPAQK